MELKEAHTANLITAKPQAARRYLHSQPHGLSALSPEGFLSPPTSVPLTCVTRVTHPQDWEWVPSNLEMRQPGLNSAGVLETLTFVPSAWGCLYLPDSSFIASLGVALGLGHILMPSVLSSTLLRKWFLWLLSFCLLLVADA